MAKRKKSRSKFAEAIDPRFTGVFQTLKNEAKISNGPKKFFKREVNSDRNEAFQKYLHKKWMEYMDSTIEFVELPPEQQHNKWEFPKIEEVELLPGIPLIPPKKKKPENPGVPILPQSSIKEENNEHDAPPKKKRKKSTESPPGVPILPQNSVKEENAEHDAPPKKKRKKEKVCKKGVTLDSDEDLQKFLHKKWMDYMESTIECVELPPEQQHNKWEFPKALEVELLPGVPLIPNKEENGQEAPPKKKRKKEKKKEKECFKDVAVTAEWLEKQAKLYIS